MKSCRKLSFIWMECDILQQQTRNARYVFEPSRKKTAKDAFECVVHVQICVPVPSQYLHFLCHMSWSFLYSVIWWEVIVCFVYIGEIVAYHYLNFLFITLDEILYLMSIPQGFRTLSTSYTCTLNGYMYLFLYHDNICQWLVAGPGTSVTSTNKTVHHAITEIVLKVALNTITLTPISEFLYIRYTYSFYSVDLFCLFNFSITDASNTSQDGLLGLELYHVHRRDTSIYKRSLMSIWDDRLSAIIMGGCASGFLILMLLCFILPDLYEIGKHIHCMRYLYKQHTVEWSKLLCVDVTNISTCVWIWKRILYKYRLL